MTSATIAARELRDTLSDVLNRVAFGRERVIVRRSNKAVAALIPIDDLRLLERVLERLEEEIDIDEARQAMEEGGESIPLADLKRELGL